MEPTVQPLEPAQTSGVRRAVIAATISGLLLVGGGVAIVSAASPAPSTSPGTAAPSTGGTSTPPATTRVGCHNGGGSSGTQGTTPATPSTPPSTPAQ